MSNLDEREALPGKPGHVRNPATGSYTVRVPKNAWTGTFARPTECTIAAAEGNLLRLVRAAGGAR